MITDISLWHYAANARSGTANLVVYPDVGARHRATMISAKLMVAEGRIERQTEHAEVPITHLVCHRLVDRSGLLGTLNAPDADVAQGDSSPGHAHEIRRRNTGSSHARTAGLPPSRDFR